MLGCGLLPEGLPNFLADKEVGSPLNELYTRQQGNKFLVEEGKKRRDCQQIQTRFSKSYVYGGEFVPSHIPGRQLKKGARSSISTFPKKR